VIPSGRVLGLDLGAKRIGVAVTDAAQTVATGVRTVTRTGDRTTDHRVLVALVEEYGAVGAVVGVPYSLSGAIGPAAAGVLAEVEELRGVFGGLGVEVATMDERLTTVAAATALRASGRRERGHRSVIDQHAAAGLLQSWIDRRHSEETSERE
jgi:putative Holliday junction resolvase